VRTLNVDIDLVADGLEVGVVEGQVKLDRFNRSNMLKCKTAVAESAPEKGSEGEISINGTPVFTGRVYESSEKGDGTVSFKCYDASHKLRSSPLNFSIEASRGGIIRSILIKTGVEDYNVRVGESEIKTLEFTGKEAAKALKNVVIESDRQWWVDAQNVLQVGPPPTQERELELVLSSETKDGQQPFEKVVVYGTSPTPVEGLSKNHILSKEQIKGVAGSADKEGETYTHKSKHITTQREADKAAKNLLREFWRQRELGKISVVGRADIRPYDHVLTPERLGGERHLVSGVTHKLNKDDGWVTVIEIGRTLEEFPETIGEAVEEFREEVRSRLSDSFGAFV